ncbi:MAG: leucyl aminopeptidase [Chitinophagaceae bacterium]
MLFKIPAKSTSRYIVAIADNVQQIQSLSLLSEPELLYFEKCFKEGTRYISIARPGAAICVIIVTGNQPEEKAEQLRKSGAKAAAILSAESATNVSVINRSSFAQAAYSVAEGMSLSAYQFLKYKTDAKKKIYSLKTIEFDKSSITVKEMQQLSIVVEAVSIARDLVNEPLNSLGAKELAGRIASLGKQAGFRTRTLGKSDIVKEKMGGILAVNRGSIDPPAFSIMEYKPARSLNRQPIVLVGKGVVYDTGGLSLKPTPNSMDRMKSDMSGAAVVTSVMYAIAKLKLPLQVIALVPATDNRPGENAYVPGDVIRMYSGTTVEVLNTDAEGRLLLADALHWAKRYKPELVIDFATLTGAAAAITGAEGMIFMGTASDQVKSAVAESGRRQYERMVELPLWKEYGDMIISDIADLKNVGGPTGGAITAGKFLEHFTDYPWLHFDIAGVSFAQSKKGYHTIGGTGFGVRVLLDFLLHYGK